MAEKILKTRKQFTSTLKSELFNKLQQLSTETRIPLTRLLDEAVELLLNEHNKEI